MSTELLVTQPNPLESVRVADPDTAALISQTHATALVEGWISPRAFLGPSAIARIDLDILAELYRHEEVDITSDEMGDAFARANLATRHAWRYGYLNPRTIHRYAGNAVA